MTGEDVERRPTGLRRRGKGDRPRWLSQGRPGAVRTPKRCLEADEVRAVRGGRHRDRLAAARIRDVPAPALQESCLPSQERRAERQRERPSRDWRLQLKHQRSDTRDVAAVMDLHPVEPILPAGVVGRVRQCAVVRHGGLLAGHGGHRPRAGARQQRRRGGAIEAAGSVVVANREHPHLGNVPQPDRRVGPVQGHLADRGVFVHGDQAAPRLQVGDSVGAGAGLVELALGRSAARDQHRPVIEKYRGVAVASLPERQPRCEASAEGIEDLDRIGRPDQAALDRPSPREHHQPAAEEGRGVLGSCRQESGAAVPAPVLRVEEIGAGIRQAMRVHATRDEHPAVGEQGGGVAGPTAGHPAGRGPAAARRVVELGRVQRATVLSRGLSSRDQDAAVEQRRRGVEVAGRRHRGRRCPALCRGVGVEDLRARQAGGTVPAPGHQHPAVRQQRRRV